MILFFEPIYKEKIWGGEYWGISAHENGPSIVKSGKLKGKTLKDLWENNRELFDNLECEKFPLLVKVIDARDDLSVQVHPDNEYAMLNENGELGKTECWYILDAKEKADIIYGVNASSKKELYELIDDEKWESLLRTENIKKGDFLYIPSGTVHAIKAGTKILEIQQNSDTTYRLYDYNRRDDSGNLRQLHLEKSKDVIDIEYRELKDEYDIEEVDGNIKTILVESEYFDVYKYEINNRIFIDNTKPFMIINVISGNGRISSDIENYDIKSDDYILITSDTLNFSIEGNLEVIISTI